VGWPDYIAGMSVKETRWDWQQMGCPISYRDAWSFPKKRQREHFRNLIRQERKHAWTSTKK
jgi:hypothetical protein